MLSTLSMQITKILLVLATVLVASPLLSAEEIKTPVNAPNVAAILSWKGYVVEFHDVENQRRWQRDETFRVMDLVSRVLATRVDQAELRRLLWLQLEFDFQKADGFSVKGYSERGFTHSPAFFRMTFNVPLASTDQEIADFIAGQMTERVLPIAKLPRPEPAPRVIKVPAAEQEKVQRMAGLCQRLLRWARTH